MHNGAIKGILTLFVFALLINLPYIHLREFQGEEGRRVIIAQNMIETGDFIVPHAEGRVYLNKPPLYNWLLAAAFKTAGTVSEASARIPSVIAAFLCAVALSLFWRKTTADTTGIFFLLPGLIFITFSDVMDKAIRAEIDMTFTLFVTLSLVLWFYYFEVRKKELSAWVFALFFVGIGALTKGVQSPAFFYCGIIPYLFYKKKPKKIFSLSHIAGISVLLAVFSVWLVPFASRVGFGEVLQAWVSEIVARKEPLQEGGFLRHFIEFPFQYVIAYLPWIPFLLLWFQKPIKKEPGIIKDLAAFCVSFLIISLPVYWIVPGARLRYVMPLSGMLAILISLPVSALINGKIKETLGKRYMNVIGCLMIFAVISSAFWGKKYDLFGSVLSVGLLVLLLSLSFLLVWRKTEISKKIALFLLVTVFVKILWASFYFPYHAGHRSHYRNAAGQINAMSPSNVPLCDLGVDNSHLVYYLKRPVLLVDSLDECITKGGSVMFMAADTEEGMALKGLSYMGKVKARDTMLRLYRCEEDADKDQAN